MTLVIQIALGIVLAVVILVLIRELGTAFLVLVVLAAIGVGIIWFAAMPVFNNVNQENFGVWATMVGGFGFVAWVWWWVQRELERRPPKSSLESTHSDEHSGSDENG